MAFFQQQFSSEEGGVINISSTGSDYFKPEGYHETDLFDFYSNGVTEPSTYISLNTNVPIVTYAEFMYLFPTASNPNQGEPESYYASEQYYTLKERIVDGGALQWLWGSYENGGVCYFRSAPNQMTLASISGFYSNGAIEEVPVYIYNVATQDFTDSQAKELKFSVDEQLVSSISPNYFPLKIYYGGSGYTGSVYTYKVVPSVTYFDMGYYILAENTTNFDYVTSLYGMYADFPIEIPFVDDIYQYIFKSRYVTLIHSLPSGAQLISGSFYGNSEIDSEGNPFIIGGYSTAGGGGGGYPNRSDEIDITNPENFAVDVVTSGFLTLYNPTAAEIIQFNQFLFSDLTDGMINQLRKLTTEPLQYLIFMAMCHFEPYSNSREEISFAGIGSGVSANKISKQYKQINCGTVTIPEATNSFLDYGGFSKVSISLPYCGIHDLNINDVMGSSIKVVYNIDQLTGACLVQVKCNRTSRVQGDTSINSVLYTFNGNCYETIPIFATDWRSAINAITGLVGNAAQAIATKDASGLLGSLAETVTSEKVKVNRSGSPSVSFGYMDIQKPYLILERPIQNIPLNYGSLQGYTSNLYRKIGKLKGFTIVYDDTLWTNNIKCSKEEADEIRRLMAQGIYL